MSSHVYVIFDEVIRIIREGDDPKAEMMARWELTEVQAEAILNMRLRAFRLEEIEIRKEIDHYLSRRSPAPRNHEKQESPAGHGGFPVFAIFAGVSQPDGARDVFAEDEVGHI